MRTLCPTCVVLTLWRGDMLTNRDTNSVLFDCFLHAPIQPATSMTRPIRVTESSNLTETLFAMSLGS